MERLSIKKSLFCTVFGYVLAFVIRAIAWTCKLKFSDTTLPQKPCVVVFWHGRLAMMPLAYRRWWQDRKINPKVIISNHKDGEIITRTIAHFGIGAIRGSSSKGAARALIAAISQIKNGGDTIITPDGPRGPKHSVSDGPFIIAKRLDVPIYALNYEASRYWQFKSWDAMILPKPFSKINFSLTEIKFDKESLENSNESIKNTLFLAAKNDAKFDT